MDVKKAVLNIGEDAAKQVWLQVVKPLIADYVAKSENKLDDVAYQALIGGVEEALLALVDKIDGEVG